MYKIKPIFKSSLPFLLLFFLFKCSPELEEKTNNPEEGIIEFDANATNTNDALYSFAPSSATLKYKKDKFAIEMKQLGAKISIIGDTKNKTITQTIQLWNLNEACVEKEKEITLDNLNFPLKIEETNETKEILGLKAHKLKVKIANDSNRTFDAWYTRELGMLDCNNLTPYASVKGVLLDYRIKKMGLEMHFVAKSRKMVKVSDSTFKIPSSMKLVCKDKMREHFPN